MRIAASNTKIRARGLTQRAQTPDALDAYAANKGTFDVLFEATGVAAALAGGITAMRPRGVVMQLGLGGDMMVPVQTEPEPSLPTWTVGPTNPHYHADCEHNARPLANDLCVGRRRVRPCGAAAEAAAAVAPSSSSSSTS